MSTTTQTIQRITDLLEQIQDVQGMIRLHEVESDDVMSRQYMKRKKRLIDELRPLLDEMGIPFGD